MIAFLSDNGWKFEATPDDAEPAILQLAAGALDKTAFTDWARKHMREKPKLELRDFFSRIDPVRFSEKFLSLLPGETHADPNEFRKKHEEAKTRIPFLRDLARQQQEAKEAGDEKGWDRVTILAVGMITLYAIAEDMGYELA